MAKKNKDAAVAGSNTHQLETSVVNANELVATEMTTHIITQPGKVDRRIEVSKVDMLGDKMQLHLDSIGKVVVPKTDRKQFVINLPDIGRTLITIKSIKDKPGRPIDPMSPRQMALREKEKKSEELGYELRQGRPVNPNSERQQRLMEQENNFKSTLRNTPEFKQFVAEGKTEEAAVQAIYDLKIYQSRRGRPANPNSENFKKNQEREEKKALYGGELPKGRPKMTPDEIMEIEGAVILPEDTVIEIPTSEAPEEGK